ncbi:MAG: hypothetical protein H0V62_10735 [Gammaproteobacteria bacterium]|nr:hypothetical protein [Gammaproteobacteria bacterium]
MGTIAQLHPTGSVDRGHRQVNQGPYLRQIRHVKILSVRDNAGRNVPIKKSSIAPRITTHAQGENT